MKFAIFSFILGLALSSTVFAKEKIVTHRDTQSVDFEGDTVSRLGMPEAHRHE